jgi:alpha-beta hydrolase superfamily lysophospholipase
MRGLYLDVSGVEPIFAVLHPAAEGQERETAVLLCPPFGWEDVCSYRSRRAWAQDLAEAGYPTLRIDLPGAGDSGGSPDDAGLLAAWTEAVGTAASWLRASTGRGRIAAIGIGLGGMLVCRAAAEGAPIGDAVLWAVPAKGRAFLRELRAFGRMESAKFSPQDGSMAYPLPRGYAGAGGFVLTAETVKSLERVDLATLELPDERLDRVLLLEREGIGVDKRLLAHLRHSGRDTTVAPGPGYNAMMAEPQEAIPPVEVFGEVRAWLSQASGQAPLVLVPDDPSEESSSDDGSSEEPGLVEEDRPEDSEPDGASSRRASATVSAPPRELAIQRDTAELRVGGVLIRETPLAIEQAFGRLFGVLTEPVDSASSNLGAVLLNAGAIRRIGPNRMWVEMARNWAARGVPSLRLDLEGLGDSDGDDTRFADVAELYIPQLVDQVQIAMDVLEAQGTAQRFVLVGLCSGAYWSFHAAARDERVAAAFMLNPRTLFWDAAQETVRYLRRGLLKPASWRMVAKGEVAPSRVAEVIRRTPGSVFKRGIGRMRRRGTADQLDLVLDVLRDDGKQLLFLFSENEPLHEELERQGRLPRNERWPNIKLELIPGRDHTLRPLYSQERAHEALDRALDRELARRSAG